MKGNWVNSWNRQVDSKDKDRDRWLVMKTMEALDALEGNKWANPTLTLRSGTRGLGGKEDGGMGKAVCGLGLGLDP